MSSAQRLGVFILPSPRREGWIAAIASRATAMGWRVLTEPEVEAAPDDTDQLLLTGDIHALSTFGALRIVVITDSPDATLHPVIEAAAQGLRANEARAGASAPWAMAAVLAEGGAEVVDGRADSVILPSFGEIAAPARIADPDPGSERGVLAVFDTLPIPVGATAAWTTDHFDYPHKREFFGGEPQVDLTGRPRGLVYGPFVHLPPGTWQVEIDVSVDPEGGRSPLRLEWGGGDTFVGHSVAVTVPGRYSLVLTSRWAETLTVQMRIWLTEGIFQGRFAFHGCRVTRVADDTPVTTEA